MDDDDALRSAVMDAAKGHRLAVIQDFAVIRAVRIDARQHLHQRGFACAVFAHQRRISPRRTVMFTLFSALTPGNFGDPAFPELHPWPSFAHAVVDTLPPGWASSAATQRVITSTGLRCNSPTRPEHPEVRRGDRNRLQQEGRDDLDAVVIGLVSFTCGSSPFSMALTMPTVTFASSRVSLKMVEYCSPAWIDLTDCSSASWPVTIGIFRVARAAAHALETTGCRWTARHRATAPVHMLVGVVRRQDVIHAGLRGGGIPAQRADLVHAGLARGDAISPESIIGCRTDMAPS